MPLVLWKLNFYRTKKVLASRLLSYARSLGIFLASDSASRPLAVGKRFRSDLNKNVAL